MTAPAKKFLIVAPVLNKDGPYYWQTLGRGNTNNQNMAHRFDEKTARELCEKEPLLKMIPA